MVITGMKYYEKKRQFENITRRTNHEKDRPKFNPKLETQGHKTRTQNVLKNDPNEILFK